MIVDVVSLHSSATSVKETKCDVLHCFKHKINMTEAFALHLSYFHFELVALSPFCCVSKYQVF